MLSTSVEYILLHKHCAQNRFRKIVDSGKRPSIVHLKAAITPITPITLSCVRFTWDIYVKFFQLYRSRKYSAHSLAEKLNISLGHEPTIKKRSAVFISMKNKQISGPPYAPVTLLIMFKCMYRKSLRNITCNTALKDKVISYLKQIMLKKFSQV